MGLAGERELFPLGGEFDKSPGKSNRTEGKGREAHFVVKQEGLNENGSQSCEQAGGVEGSCLPAVEV